MQPGKSVVSPFSLYFTSRYTTGCRSALDQPVLYLVAKSKCGFSIKLDVAPTEHSNRSSCIEVTNTVDTKWLIRNLWLLMSSVTLKHHVDGANYVKWKLVLICVAHIEKWLPTTISYAIYKPPPQLSPLSISSQNYDFRPWLTLHTCLNILTILQLQTFLHAHVEKNHIL